MPLTDVADRDYTTSRVKRGKGAMRYGKVYFVLVFDQQSSGLPYTFIAIITSFCTVLLPYQRRQILKTACKLVSWWSEAIELVFYSHLRSKEELEEAVR